jgi:hypothetical protein
MRFLVLVPLVMALASVEGALKSPEPDTLGAERCRLCHRSVYDAWSNTAHARATDSVVSEPRSRGCFDCHATGPQALQGVQCEACHGPGGNYWQPEVMMDPQKAKEAGLVEQTESVCRSCHGSGLPEHASSFTMPREAERPHAIH